MFRYFEPGALNKSYFYLSGLLLAVMVIGYFFFIHTHWNALKQKILEKKQLEQSLHAEKLPQTLPFAKPLPVTHRYLDINPLFLEGSFLISHLVQWITKENILLKNILLADEKEEDLYRKFHIRLSLLSGYQAFIQFYCLMRKQPYLTEITQFKLEKFKQAREDRALHAEVSIHIYVFK